MSPYRDLFEKIEGKPVNELTVRCPLCGCELRAYRRDYLHTMVKHRFTCRPCNVDISIKTEKEND